MHFHFLDLYKILRGEELREIYANLALKNFAISMISVFIPVYLYKLNYSLNSIFLFIFFFYLSEIILSPLISYISSRIGLKHAIMYSIPFMILYFFLLLSLEDMALPLNIIAFIGGFAVAFYWIPLNTDFARSSDKRLRGEETGFMVAISQISVLLGPIIGAFILKYFGFNILFLMVIFILFLSLIPFLRTYDVRQKGYKFDFKAIFHKSHRKYILWFIANGILMITEIIFWPFYVYLLFLNTTNVGFVSSLKGVGSMLFAFTVGKFADVKAHRMRNLLIKIGAISLFFINFIRFMMGERIEIFTISLLGGLMFSLLNIPFFAKTSDKASMENILEFMTLREIFLSVGRISLIIIALLFANKINIAFIMSSLSSLIFLL